MTTVEHLYDESDRRRQLTHLRNTCRSIAKALKTHGDQANAEWFLAIADHAHSLGTSGFDADDLRELSNAFPAAGWWYHPYDLVGPFKRWQEDVIGLHQRATTIARDLRAIGYRD